MEDSLKDCLAGSFLRDDESAASLYGYRRRSAENIDKLGEDLKFDWRKRIFVKQDEWEPTPWLDDERRACQLPPLEGSRTPLAQWRRRCAQILKRRGTHDIRNFGGARRTRR